MMKLCRAILHGDSNYSILATCLLLSPVLMTVSQESLEVGCMTTSCALCRRANTATAEMAVPQVASSVPAAVSWPQACCCTGPARGGPGKLLLCSGAASGRAVHLHLSQPNNRVRTSLSAAVDRCSSARTCPRDRQPRPRPPRLRCQRTQALLRQPLRWGAHLRKPRARTWATRLCPQLCRLQPPSRRAPERLPRP